MMQPPEPDSSNSDIDLSVVIPAYNERFRLPSTLVEMVAFLDRRPLHYEIVVVNDGSTDDTAAIVEQFRQLKPQVRLIGDDINRGKGYAVRVGMLEARGRQILFADADGATPFQEIDRLLTASKAGAELVIGSRALCSADTRVSTNFLRKAMGRTFNRCVNLVLLPEIADTQCGFKLFSRRAAHKIFSRARADGFSFDIEILYIARRLGIPIKEVPINWKNIQGSKVNLLLDSLRMFLDIFRFRWRHRSVALPDNQDSGQ